MNRDNKRKTKLVESRGRASGRGARRHAEFEPCVEQHYVKRAVWWEAAGHNQFDLQRIKVSVGAMIWE